MTSKLGLTAAWLLTLPLLVEAQYRPVPGAPIGGAMTPAARWVAPGLVTNNPYTGTINLNSRLPIQPLNLWGGTMGLGIGFTPVWGGITVVSPPIVSIAPVATPPAPSPYAVVQGTGQSTLPASLPIQLVVELPETAELWLEGKKTYLQGSERTFVLPALPPGTTRSYRLRAKWKEGEVWIDRSQEIILRPGDSPRVVFRPSDE